MKGPHDVRALCICILLFSRFGLLPTSNFYSLVPRHSRQSIYFDFISTYPIWGRGVCRRHYAHSLALLVAMATVGYLMAAFFAVASPTAVSPYMCACSVRVRSDAIRRACDCALNSASLFRVCCRPACGCSRRERIQQEVLTA